MVDGMDRTAQVGRRIWKKLESGLGGEFHGSVDIVQGRRSRWKIVGMNTLICLR